MRRSARVVAGFVGVLALAACGSRPADPPLVAEVGASADCLADEVLGGVGGVPPQGGPRPAPAAGSVPDDFEPVLVVECRARPGELASIAPPVLVPEAQDLAAGESELLAEPQPTTLATPRPDDEPAVVARIQEITRDGDLTALLAALDRPSQAPGPDGVCPAIGYLVPQIFLVDAAGRAVRPVWPHDACGMPLTGTASALDALGEIGARELERTIR